MPAKNTRPPRSKPGGPRPPESSERTVQRLQGYITWIYLTGEEAGGYERFEVKQAVLRGGRELVIDCDCADPGDSPYVYTITLRREDSLLFRGEWSAGKASDRDSGTCSCRLYSNGDRIAFIGVWKQKGGTEHWLAEFTPVEKIEA